MRRCETCTYWMHIAGSHGDCAVLNAAVPAFAGSDCMEHEFVRTEATREAQQAPIATPARGDTVFLVSGVAKRSTFAAPARDLYISDLFRRTRQYLEQSKVPWFIVSAKHGLLPPDQIIAPYEQTLNAMPARQRRSWAARVVAQLSERSPSARHVVFLAGAHYRECLVEPLQERGITVTAPMKRLPVSKHLQWLEDVNRFTAAPRVPATT